MAGMLWLALAISTVGNGPGDEGGTPRTATLPTLNIRLTAPEPRSPRVPRIAAEVLPLDLMPGDRPTSELTADTTERPREPGAPVKARMSMRLDDGRNSLRPDFALGGLGGALMRMSGALFED